MDIQSVQDLINELQKVDNKDADVFVYVGDEPVRITMIDTSFDNNERVDLNIDVEF